MSYRRAGTEVRQRAEREWIRNGVPGWSPHSRLLEDWVEVFAPVLWDRFGPKEWPDILVLDSVPFRLRETSRAPKKKVAFNVMAALGYTSSGQGRIWRYEAFPTRSAQRWTEFLRSLPGRPRHVVCDDDGGILSALGKVWPATQTEPAPVVHLCQWHLKKNARDILEDNHADAHNHPLSATPEY